MLNQWKWSYSGRSRSSTNQIWISSRQFQAAATPGIKNQQTGWEPRSENWFSLTTDEDNNVDIRSHSFTQNRLTFLTNCFNPKRSSDSNKNSDETQSSILLMIMKRREMMILVENNLVISIQLLKSNISGSMLDTYQHLLTMLWSV